MARPVTAPAADLATDLAARRLEMAPGEGG